MSSIEIYFNRKWKIHGWLLLFSLSFFMVYFGKILFHPNACLSSITGDSLKNYYTFVFFAKNDGWSLYSHGMNFPFGEHFIFTDCIPLLAFACKLFPFTHDYLIGILHLSMLFSIIVCPLIYYNIFMELEFPRVAAFLISLAIPLLTPQFMRLEAGHPALLLAFIIPFSIYLVLKFLRQPEYKTAVRIFLYNFILFFVHPYHGLSVTLFCLLSMGIYFLFNRGALKRIKSWLQIFMVGLLPLIVFRIFLALTDRRTDRIENPWGSDQLTSQPGSLLVPLFGPFQKPLATLLHSGPGSFEGICYLGIFIIGFLALVIIGLPLAAKRISINIPLLSLLLSAIILLMISFGWHAIVIRKLDLTIGALSQFRAPGRFSWFFYYLIPIILFSTLKSFLTGSGKPMRIFNIVAMVYLCFNIFEANYYFTFFSQEFWQYRNFFSRNYLNDQEKKVLDIISDHHPQAILPLPIYHTGSDAISRGQCDATMVQSTMYSVHAGLPILSNLISRTSISESAQAIELLNSYKKENPARALLNEDPFLVIQSADELIPDEERLLPYIDLVVNTDSLRIGLISKQNLLLSKIRTTKNKTLFEDSVYKTENLVFIKSEKRKPFIQAQFKDYETALVLDSNQLEPGKYVVSFRYHFNDIHYTTLACHLIVTRQKGKKNEWAYNRGMQKLSGFYKGYGIYEDFIEIEKGTRHEFIFKGLFEKGSYFISHFLLRPVNTTVFIKSAKGDTLVNNFPER